MTITERPGTATGQPGYDLSQWERRFIGGHVLVAIVALGIGSLIGPLQALSKAADERRMAETAATRVNFFTMVRGED